MPSVWRIRTPIISLQIIVIMLELSSLRNADAKFS